MNRMILVAISIVLLMPTMAAAQLAGANTKGDIGLLSGTQPPPGFYVVPVFYQYSPDSALDKNGDELPPILGGGSIDIKAGVVGLLWVSDFKIFGANYSAAIWPALANGKLQFPVLEINRNLSTGFADLYIQPFTLGWHLDRADFTAGLGLFAPTGKYETSGENNTGLGMWTYEIFGGTTLFLDKAKSWNFATTASYEIHGKKEDSDVRVGDILTLEGGLGKSFMKGAFNVGVAYYAQWKITNDDFGLDSDLPDGPLFGKHRVYGFGPDVTIPLASKKKFWGSLNLRYFWETGARTTLQGSTFIATLAFPIPSIPLQ